MSTHDHAHDHGHTHDHSHGPGHSHSHGGGDDPYYLDQLCLVGLSAAFGSICLALYFWRTDILTRMLAPQFHLYILISGFALVAIALMRGVVLWLQVGQVGADHNHDHAEPGHEHHEGCTHEHHVGHAGCAHDPAHEHHHHGEHGHEGHDHGWAPWRYVMLLIPIILFLIGLPNKDLQVEARDTGLANEHPTEIPTLLAMGPPSLAQMAIVPKLLPYFRSDKAQLVEFAFLEGCAGNPTLRDKWKGQMVKVRGQYVPDRKSDRVFSLGRFRIQCCAADAVQLNVPMMSREPVRNFKQSEWVEVTGEIDFYADPSGVYHTMLRVHSGKDIIKSTPEANPYVGNL